MAVGVHTGVPAGLELPERYRPVRRLGAGGMATVWCAHDRLLDRPVAVKVLAEPLTADPAAVRRFKREARTAARLSSHANVVTIFDISQCPAAGGEPGRPFIVMECLRGGTVAEALRVRAVSEDEALRWLGQAAAALDFAHRRGVIHRDIKPSNFLLDIRRTLQVADFGIAMAASEETLTGSGQLLGTAAYLAPECALGLPAGEASDRYSLAVTAYELLVGRRPFNAENFAALVRQHLEEDPPRPSRIAVKLPTSLDTVLARGLAKRPDERFATAQELVEEIGHALGQDRVAVTVPLPSRPQPTGPWAARSSSVAIAGRSRRAAFAGLIALLLVALIAAAASGGRQPATARNRSAATPRGSVTARSRPVRRTAAPTRARASSGPASPSPPDRAPGDHKHGHGGPVGHGDGPGDGGD